MGIISKRFAHDVSSAWGNIDSSKSNFTNNASVTLKQTEKGSWQVTYKLQVSCFLLFCSKVVFFAACEVPVVRFRQEVVSPCKTLCGFAAKVVNHMNERENLEVIGTRQALWRQIDTSVSAMNAMHIISKSLHDWFTLAACDSTKLKIEEKHFGFHVRFVRPAFCKNQNGKKGIFSNRQRPTCDDCLNHAWLVKAVANDKASRKSLSVAVGNLKKFVARRKWIVSQRTSWVT